ncbi:MAG: FtsW/RodA/SpoVE family cell cycle protein [Saprospiraceae bacterium]|nr:FtsW/RodA/SpoVE family cell cycle protein [Bacteroidia bacterium]NNE13500.1 FtsW/RodA/SpoVE family cell cycle protein [Saprospiraceae bacterium]NNL91644.1 FtsW/RodA/SpoVE family cell cycle protein [Saprospiraceae bacterium]
MRSINNIYDNLKGDKTIWFLITLLGLCSLLAVYSAIGHKANIERSGNTEYYLIKHGLLLIVGISAMYFAYRFNYMIYSKLAPLLLIIAIPLLAYTVLFGPEINEARRWFEIPLIDQKFQPSDLARLALVMFIARSIAKKQDVIKDFKSAFVPLIIPIVGVCSLIAPADLSTAALLFVTCLLMMIIGRVSMKYVLLLGLIGIAALSFIIVLGTVFPDFIRLETWISRLDGFWNNTNPGFQIEQSKIAIASGEIFGVGPGNSMQRNFLPYAYADFIYAIICEEYGLTGAFLVIGFYLGLFYRCTKMVTRCPKTFGSILAVGLCLNVVIQAFANMAVSVELVPVTGLTLPIISMGGTSILFTCISLGIILSVSKYVEEYSAYELMEEEQAITEEKVDKNIIGRNRLKYENYY